MIKKSFIFLEKVGSTKEQSIWKQGIADWHDFLNVKSVNGISQQKKQYYNRKLREAQHALREENPSHFIHKLPKKEMWRLYDYFREEVGYVDIEVDSYGKIVLIGISNYYNSNFFVKGVNLESTNIENELQKYKLIVTYNGHSFDIPKIQKELKINIKVPHIDLKPLCVNLGLKGGLKEIEKKLNLKRPQNLYGNPVDLWKAFHASGDREYLELLIAYNGEDCENLKSVMNKVYTILSKRIGKISKKKKKIFGESKKSFFSYGRGKRLCCRHSK